MEMYRFFGQPKFDPEHIAAGPIGYELFIRENINGEWVLPHDFISIPSTIFGDLLRQTVSALPQTIDLISFNLEQEHFVQEQYLQLVQAVQRCTRVVLYTELTERNAESVTVPQLVDAAKHFHEYGLRVVLDDVGTEQNNEQLASAMDDYVDEYKFALQNLRPFSSIAQIKPELAHWWQLAKQHDKTLAIEGIESAEELALIRAEFPSEIVQGYFLGKPALLPIKE